MRVAGIVAWGVGLALRAGCFRFVVFVCVALMGTGCSRAPLNPPRLVMTSDTDMSIQLFMQSTILLSNYYGFSTIKYSELRERSSRAGLELIPFMPPETVRATPELVGFFNTYENNAAALDQALKTYGGYKVLVKYYIRTGLRASQALCRNYLLNLEERSEYLEFLKKEVGVAAALSTSVLALVNANATLSQAFLIARTGFDGGIDAYEEYRFLNIDREAARTLVEAAQNALAQNFFKQVDSASPDSNVATGGYTFSDALHAVSTIEYQCTRSGIRNLLTRSINNSPSNLAVDEVTGMLIFRSAKQATVIKDTPRSDAKVVAPPPPVANTNVNSPVVVAKPPAGTRSDPSGSDSSHAGGGGAAVSKTVLNNFELSLVKADIEQFQKAACMKPTGAEDLGELGSETRLAIQKALGSADQLLTDRKAILLRKKLKDGVTCPPA